MVADLKKAGVEEISDFMNMEDDLREKLVPVSDQEMAKLASICNRYPLVEITCSLSPPEEGDSYDPEEPINLKVNIARDEDSDDEEALAPFN